MITQTTDGIQQDRVRTYPGCKVHFKLTSKESNNALTVMYMQMKPGSELPRHYHSFEDETVIIHSGAITFFVGDDIICAKAGDVIFIPRTVPHSYVIMTDLVTCSVVAKPGQLEKFYELVTSPGEKDWQVEKNVEAGEDGFLEMHWPAGRMGTSFC